MTYILVAILPDGARKPLSREYVQQRGPRFYRVRDIGTDEPHRMSRKRALRAASDLLDWEDVRAKRCRVEVVPLETP